MFDFCGIGNACIDIIVHVDDSFLREWKFTKGICTHIDLEMAKALDAALVDPVYIPGGCAANTAAGLSALGGTSAFIGRLAKDRIGDMTVEDMAARNIRFNVSPDTTSNAGSTRVYTFITGDSERTFASFYGVQEDLNEKDLDYTAIKNATFLCLDGYALNARDGVNLFLKAADIARKAEKTVVFTPNDFSILEQYNQAVTDISKISDIFLCNEQEALCFTRTSSLPEAVKALKSQFRSGVVTLGKKGAFSFNKNEDCLVPAAIPPAPVIDTNGAGDQFTAGFLYGLSRSYTLENATRLGNSCASVIITHTGARPRPDFKETVKIPYEKR